MHLKSKRSPGSISATHRPEQKTLVLQPLNAQGCTCGCGLTVASAASTIRRARSASAAGAVDRRRFHQHSLRLATLRCCSGTDRAARACYRTDGGQIVYGSPGLGGPCPLSRGCRRACSRIAQRDRIPVTCRGGGLTTEGESVAPRGILLDLKGMNRLLDCDGDTAWVEAGMTWHQVAEALRPRGTRLHERTAQHALHRGRHARRRRHRRQLAAPRLLRGPGRGTARS